MPVLRMKGVDSASRHHAGYDWNGFHISKNFFCTPAYGRMPGGLCVCDNTVCICICILYIYIYIYIYLYLYIYILYLFIYTYFLYTIYEATLHLKARPSHGSPVACSCCNKTLAETPAIPKILKQRELRSMPGRSNYRNRIHKHM